MLVHICQSAAGIMVVIDHPGAVSSIGVGHHHQVGGVSKLGRIPAKAVVALRHTIRTRSPVRPTQGGLVIGIAHSAGELRADGIAADSTLDIGRADHQFCEQTTIQCFLHFDIAGGIQIDVDILRNGTGHSQRKGLGAIGIILVSLPKGVAHRNRLGGLPFSGYFNRPDQRHESVMVVRMQHHRSNDLLQLRLAFHIIRRSPRLAQRRQ